ncbi:TetR/AcrR family transcriptional regulator [Streptomyces bambusae]|uniref:TetR/AcrR family transcriptional regulator n=1 Tax=Streptomyces bambusae TaxID=1550616 RepID=UPI001CFC5DC8|nr:TetR/AcrR family transcriptional regulator [Streptomyces bambusae]MCB5164541.1 TetR/AcrR family transcriptional regulator [Streptomyces bambusae]
MARVSQAHLDARRRQILDGATRCFTRNGFHATSMQDVLKEADLSAGAVYRYFRSKEELIAAIAEETFTSIRGAFETAAQQSPLPTPDLLLAEVLGTILETRAGDPAAGPRDFPRLMLQVWTETLRNEELAALLRRGYEEISGLWVGLVAAYREAGMLPADVPAEHVARTLIASAQGYVAQQALFGGVDPGMLRDGLRGLMSMGGAEPTTPR